MANDPGSNKYTGVVRSDTGAPLEGVEIKLRYTNSSGQSILKTVKTGKDGVWSTSIENGIDPSTVTLTYVKSGYSSFTIENPKVSDTFQFPPPSIDKYRGGTFKFEGGFDVGKYLISSLDQYDQSLLDYNLAGALEFIKFYEIELKKPGFAKIRIDASESKLGNTDLEPSSSNGTANPNFKAGLNEKVLSGYRADNLEKYITKYFKDNGATPPSITRNLLVGGPAAPAPGTFPKRDTPGYAEAIKPYLPYQYVKLQALLTGPPCAEIPFDGARFGSVNITKPPGTKTISLDALNFPDRFGFSATGQSTDVIYDDVFYQNPAAPGSLLSWGFMAYLRLGRTPSPPFPNQNEFGDKPYRKLVTTKDVYASLLADWFIQNDGTTDPNNPGLIGKEIYNWNKTRYESAGRAYLVSPKNAKENIDIMFDVTPKLGAFVTAEGIQTNLVYSYTIIRASRVYDISNVPDFGVFSIYYQAGNLIAPSVFKYKLCPN